VSADNSSPWVEAVLQLLLDARETEALAEMRLALGHSITEALRFHTSEGKVGEARDRVRSGNLYILSEFFLDKELWDEAVTAFAWTIKLSEEIDDVYFIESARFSKAFCHKMLGQRDEMLKETRTLSADKTYFVGASRGFGTLRDLLD